MWLGNILEFESPLTYLKGCKGEEKEPKMEKSAV